MMSSLLMSRSSREHGITTKLIPLIILVLIPAILPGLVMSFGYGQDVVITFSLPWIEVPIDIFTMDLIFVSIVIAFALCPIFYNNIGQFKKYSKDKTKEYRCVKKIILIEISILIILTILNYFYLLSPDLLHSDEFTYWIVGYLSNLNYFIAYAVTGGLLWIAFNHTNKEFNYYLARGCFENIGEKNEVSKIEYVERGLKYYNRYLEKVLKLQINDIDEVISKILADPGVDKYMAIEWICKAFESKEKLKPVSSISTILNIQEVQKFLVKERMGQKIKDIGTYVLASIIPAAASLIPILYPRPL
jgi:hypothetical protein